MRIVIPVLGRPERVAPLLESLRGSQRDAELRPLFIATEGDRREIAALEAAEGAPFEVLLGPRRPGDYARKINMGVAVTTEHWIFTAADDLCFCPGWADEAIRVARARRKRVVGTNDMGNRRTITGQHSTHTLVHRSYVELGTVDEPGKLLHEGYDHNFVDDEFIQTATLRREYVAAKHSHVEHLHPAWGKGEGDRTYTLGMERFEQDRAHFRARQRLLRQAHAQARQARAYHVRRRS